MGVAAGAHLALGDQLAENITDLTRARNRKTGAFTDQFGQQFRGLQTRRTGPQDLAIVRGQTFRQSDDPPGRTAEIGEDIVLRRFDQRQILFP